MVTHHAAGANVMGVSLVVDKHAAAAPQGDAMHPGGNSPDHFCLRHWRARREDLAEPSDECVTPDTPYSSGRGPTRLISPRSTLKREGQFIQAGLPQQPAKPDPPDIVGRRFPAGSRASTSGSEFEDRERLARDVRAAVAGTEPDAPERQEPQRQSERRATRAQQQGQDESTLQHPHPRGGTANS